MTTQQPEALRLAEWIESDMCCDGDAAIVAELRRLHAESELHLQELRSYRITVENREARIAELESQIAAAQQGVKPSVRACIRAELENWHIESGDVSHYEALADSLASVIQTAQIHGTINTEGQVAQQGWKMVPEVATSNMVNAGEDAFCGTYDYSKIPDVYAEMIAAAPKPPTKQQYPATQEIDAVRQVPKAIKIAPIGNPAKVEIVWECVGQERPNIHMECWHIDGADLVRGANIGALVGLANMLLDEAEKQGHSFAAQAKQGGAA